MIKRETRTVVAVIAVIAVGGLALLAGGCGGGSASTGSGSSSGTPVSASSPSPLAFSRCMRSHGVSSFPDPNSSGEIPKNEVVPLASSPRFRAAQGLCQHLLPNPGAQTSTHAEVEAALGGMVRVAACMHSRGVQDWPDPTVDREHPDDPRPVFMLASIDPDAPQISADISACQHLMPESTPPYICSRVLAQRIGGPPGAFACDGGSPEVP